MSSKKRRTKRRILLLVRMDQTRMLMWLRKPRAGVQQFIEGCMYPLGRKLARQGHTERAWSAMKAAGTDAVTGSDV